METLKELYKKHWNDYLNNIRRNPDIDPANPFLIVVPKDYTTKEKRVMFCGQETQGWGNEFDDNPESATIDALLRIYNGFVNSGGYNSPYWSFINAIKEKCPNTSFVCNNIVKIGKRTGAGCDDKINDLTLKHFPVLPEELKILNPDMIVFLTGPKYDWRIAKALGHFKTEEIKGFRKFDKIVFDNSLMPLSYRCYHPRYLRYCKQESFVRSFLIETINTL